MSVRRSNAITPKANRTNSIPSKTTTNNQLVQKIQKTNVVPPRKSKKTQQITTNNKRIKMDYKSNNYFYNENDANNEDDRYADYYDHTQKEKNELSKRQKEYHLTHKNPFKGKKHSDETKKIMSKKAKMRKPNNKIAIQMFDDNENLLKTFDSKKDALNYLNITCYKPLTRAIELHTKYKNYYWKKKN